MKKNVLFKLTVFSALAIQFCFSTLNAQSGASLNFIKTVPGDKIILPTTISSSLATTNKITVEAWVRPSAANTSGCIIGNYSNPGNNMQFLLRANSGGQFQFWIGNSAGSYLNCGSATAPTVNVWQHVVGVWNGTVSSIYINGVLSNTAAVGFTAFGVETNSLIIGGNTPNENFDGDIDEVRIWNVARTQCEINTFMNCEIPTSALGLMANYHFNEGIAAANNATATTLPDFAGGNLTGTLTGIALTGATSNWVTPGGVVSGFTTTLAPPTITVTANPALSTCLNNTISLTGSGASTYTWSGGVTNAVAFTASATAAYSVSFTAANGCTNTAVASVTTNICPGESLKFDGVNDNVNCGTAITSSLVNSSALTIEAWINPSTLPGNGPIVSNHDGGGGTQFCLRTSGTSYNFFLGFGTYGITTAANTASLNTYQHVAGVFNGTSLKLYINGVLSTSLAIPSYALQNSIQQVLIGRDGFSSFYNGNVDEIRIWKSARTQCEINTFMNCEIPANAPNLLANYHFNQGTAFANNSTVTTLTDATSNAYNGTLSSFGLNTGNVVSNWASPGAVAAGYTTTLAPPSVTITANPALSTCLNNTISLTGSGASTYTWSGGVTNAVAFTASATTAYSVSFTAANGCTNTAVASVTTNNCPGEALSFDGVNDFVDGGIAVTNVLKGLDKMTVEAWIYPTQNTVGKSVIGNHGSNTQFNIQQTTTNQLTFFIGFGTYVVNTPVNSIQMNTWQHVAGVFDDNVIKVYLNGVLSGSTAVPNTYVLDVNGSTNLMIGKSGFGEQYQGFIDEVRIWNTARTHCEINTFKNCEIPTNAANLLVNYHFNQGTAFANNTTVTIANDATSSAINGTLSTFALTAGNINSNWVAPGSVPAGYTTAIAAPGYTNSTLVICPNGTVVLGSTNATSYTWTPSITNNSPFTPTASTTYSFAGTNSITTCTISAAVNVTVNPSPTVTAVSSETNVICVGQSATLTAGGASTYTWNTTSTTAVIAISPSVTTSYTVTGTDANGCSNAATITQSVSACTGLASNIISSSNLVVYPNPFNNKLVVESGDKNSSVVIYNAIGSIVYSTKIENNTTELNLNQLSAGVYFVKVNNAFVKVIKN